MILTNFGLDVEKLKVIMGGYCENTDISEVSVV